MYNDELEELTLKFLREHDEYFTKKNKNNLMEYPYLTARQEKYRQSKEITFSNLSNKQKLKCPKLGDSVQFEEGI